MTELAWDEIADRFSEARNWWVATAGAGGPHAVPVWGVALGGVLHFYGEASAVRTRNLAADPRLVLHLEDGDAPLIVHGRATSLGRAADHPAAVAAYAEKYREATDLPYRPDHPDVAGVLLFSIEAARAITWDLDAFETSDRRWRAATIRARAGQ